MMNTADTSTSIPTAEIHERSIARAREIVARELAEVPAEQVEVFERRFEKFAPDVVQLLYPLYGEREDCVQCIAGIFGAAANAYRERPQALKVLDLQREENPRWYQQHKMMGGVCYVERFAGDLPGLRQKIPYFKELGLTYLHLMPLFRTPPGPDDGGYAVSSYREVDSDLGTMDDLRVLADDLRAEGISLALDFVFNHTAKDHEWARCARQGDEACQQYYYMFDDRTIPDQYEQTLREIFPEDRPGSFTHYPDLKKWVWTTFHSYQWDLNYKNPVVFQRMLEEMLFLANVGAEILRLDAVPFIWKEMGTTCENLPQAHQIIRAFNALKRIAAPGMIFKSEAIVHPDDVQSYLGMGKWAGRECEISYNPLLMVQIWEALATSYTHFITYAMQRRFEIPDACAWVNYIRSHDDIGWGFADEDAEQLGIQPFYHRQFLNRFYTGEEEGSFAAGLPFQFNPKTLDMRISGTAASLAGLEEAVAARDDRGIELAIRRILLMYGIVLSMGGIPLLYLGDEIGSLNDYSYLEHPERSEDSRWAHRPVFDWKKAGRRHVSGTIEARIFQPLTHMIKLRKEQPAFNAISETQVLDLGNNRIYAFAKSLEEHRVLVLANFTGEQQNVRLDNVPSFPALNGVWMEMISGRNMDILQQISLEAYELLWITHA